MSARKPKILEVGKAYRLYAPFSREPGRQIALVTHIIQATKTTRQVKVDWLFPGPDWDVGNYSYFLSRVHSEAPTAVN